VDRSFVVGMEADESAAKVTGAIIAMAKQLGLEIVVEGVDNPLQLKRLGEFGASVIQGFLFSRPLPKEALISYVESQGWQDVLQSLD
jgi:EAL domain-containing protein (putative c-di-GMP-specific phosphodiesterase class I)